MYEKRARTGAWLLVTLLLSIAVTALPETCGDTVLPRHNCTFITPSISCAGGTYNYTVYNSTNIVKTGNLTLINETIYKFTFNQSEGVYVIKLCDDSTRSVTVAGGDLLTSLAITFFIMIVNIFVFALPWLVERFSKNEMTDLAAKRFCWGAGLMLLLFNTSIVLTLAENAGLGITQELLLYVTILVWGIYLFLLFLMIRTTFDFLEIIKKRKELRKEERAGEGEDE